MIESINGAKIKCFPVGFGNKGTGGTYVTPTHPPTDRRVIRDPMNDKYPSEGKMKHSTFLRMHGRRGGVEGEGGGGGWYWKELTKMKKCSGREKPYKQFQLPCHSA